MSKNFKSDHPNLQFDDQTLVAVQVIANVLHYIILKPPLPSPTHKLTPLASKIAKMAISSTPNSIVKHPRDTYSQQQTWVSNDKKQYYHKTSALAVILLESKIIVNSTISTPGAKFYTIGVKDFFLSSTLP